jgi:hypothetical protein
MGRGPIAPIGCRQPGCTEPNPAANRIHEELLRSVCLPMYDRLKPLYGEIRRITSYPPG